MSDFQVLLFYKYVDIADPVAVVNYQRALCEELGLKGRVIIAQEGINGTLEGTVANTEKYIERVIQDTRFADINWKKDRGTTGSLFPKLTIRVRDEIVTTGIKDKDFGPHKGLTGKYILAQELYDWYEQGKEFYALDMRNDFEYEVGRFQNSIFPEGLYHFRDLPTAIKQIEHLKNKTVVTVCTGGVRCEVASGLLLKYGFKDVYQLQNGIVTFMKQFPNKYFDGKLYVFDGRMAVGFNEDSPEHKVIGRCRICGAESEHFVNWNEPTGERKHGIICEQCCLEGRVNLQEGYHRLFQKMNQQSV